MIALPQSAPSFVVAREASEWRITSTPLLKDMQQHLLSIAPGSHRTELMDGRQIKHFSLQPPSYKPCARVHRFTLHIIGANLYEILEEYVTPLEPATWSPWHVPIDARPHRIAPVLV